jgi:hypothetical protein
VTIPRSALALCMTLGAAAGCAEPDDDDELLLLGEDTATFTVLGLCRGQPMVAERRYAPNLWLDARTTLDVGLHFRIPASLPVIQGNSGNHTATLRFGASATSGVVTCSYVGVGVRPAPTDPAEIAAANRYDFVACSDGSVPGTAVTAPYLHVRISSGGDYITPGGRTVVRVDLQEASPCCEGGDLPPMTDELCDSIDNDCDAVADEDAGGPWMLDADGDGAGNPATGLASCTPVVGRVLAGGDCNDGNPAIYPGAPETCNSADEDCDAVSDEGVTTAWYRDDDADRFGRDANPVLACDAPPLHVAVGGDCNDDDDDIFPGAIERCDGLDNDCDAIRDDGWFLDDDADRFGDPARPAGGACVEGRFVFNSGDCDDDNDDVHPFATEVCDGVDQDCDDRIDDNAVDAPEWYADRDGDGFGDPAVSLMACGSAPTGFVADDDDCDDGDDAVHPGASDPGGDGRDTDCDGSDG